ncbi:MAG: hypothetical protein WAK17_21680, partial [Candidatus Nitrosopolaris sp.]
HSPLSPPFSIWSRFLSPDYTIWIFTLSQYSPILSVTALGITNRYRSVSTRNIHLHDAYHYYHAYINFDWTIALVRVVGIVRMELSKVSDTATFSFFTSKSVADIPLNV